MALVKKSRLDLSEERRILSHLIVDTTYLSQLQDVADPSLFESPYGRIVYGWVKEFYEIAKEAPGKAIQDVYVRKRRELQDEEELELVADFLSQLSKDWSKAEVHNVEYSVRQATDWFKLQSLKRLHEQLGASIAERDSQGGEKVVGDYRRVERTAGHCVSLMRDPDDIAEAFNREHETLFAMPGALGDEIGPFSRGDFVAFAAPPKRGKSWWLQAVAQRGAMCGLKVLFVTLEMTKHQMLRRMWTGLTGLPEKGDTIRIPYFTSDGEIEFKEEFREAVSANKADIEHFQNYVRLASRGGEVRLQVYASNGASVKDLEAMLDNLEFYEDWMPDVLVVDYADIMCAEDQRLEYRHKLDHIWKRLRGLASDRNILVVTASQSGKATLKKDAGETDIAEDYRKLAHVTKLILLNQTEQEKSNGIMRVKASLQREGKSVSRQVVVLECRAIGRAVLASERGDRVHSDLVHKIETEKE